MKWLKITLLWSSLAGLAFLLFEGASDRPEGRALLVVALGWLGIVQSVRWVERD